MVYVVQESRAVPSEVDDPLDTDSYHVEGGNLYEEMVARLSYNGPKYKHDNTSVYTNIRKEARGASVESNVKAFFHFKDGKGSFLALVMNHAGNTKCHAILKKHMELLQNIKQKARS